MAKGDTMVQPGWYDDPAGSGRKRWWDGAAWTAHLTPTPSQGAHPPVSPFVTPSPAPVTVERHKTRKARPVVIVMTTIIVLVIASVAGVGYAFIGALGDSADASEAAALEQEKQAILDDLDQELEGEESAEEVYYLRDRQAYAIYVSSVEASYEHWKNISDEELFQIVPNTDEGLRYYKDFMIILTDMHAANAFGTTQTSLDPDELDAMMNAQLVQLRDYEVKFQAGDDLNVQITLYRPDGTAYESDGHGIISARKQAESDLDTAEAKAAAYVATGGYDKVGEDLAGIFGLGVSWIQTRDQADDYCTGKSLLEWEHTAAFYCSASPYKVWVNASQNQGAQTSFSNTMRHELSHHAINIRCGTAAPEIVGDLKFMESVTNAYSILYLGADENEVRARTEYDDIAPWYRLTDKSFDVAKAIHGGECTSLD